MARSSAGERRVYTAKVVGSKPTAPTIEIGSKLGPIVWTKEERDIAREITWRGAILGEYRPCRLMVNHPSYKRLNGSRLERDPGSNPGGATKYELVGVIELPEGDDIGYITKVEINSYDA